METRSETRQTQRGMKVLMTADTIGGVWTYAIELIDALASHGVDFILATMGKRLSEDQRGQLRNLSNVELYESAYQLEWMEGPWNDVAAAGEWLLQLERDLHPDLIHLNNFAHGSLPWEAPIIVVGHSCVCSWWDAVRRTALPQRWSVYADKTRSGLAGASVVIAPSKAMMGELDRFYGPLARKRMIHNFRNPSHFHPHRKEEFILSAGRLWDEAKNTSLLSQIAVEIPWPIFLAGEDRHPGCLEKRMTRSLSPLGRLNTDQLGDWMGRASIYAAPALYEPFGLSILEAALCGCALVLGDIPSLRELWEGAAVFVPPRDAVALKKALLNMINNPGLRREQGALAQCRSLQFSPVRIGKAYVDLYRETCGPETIATPTTFYDDRNVLSQPVV